MIDPTESVAVQQEIQRQIGLRRQEYRREIIDWSQTYDVSLDDTNALLERLGMDKLISEVEVDVAVCMRVRLVVTDDKLGDLRAIEQRVREVLDAEVHPSIDTWSAPFEIVSFEKTSHAVTAVHEAD